MVVRTASPGISVRETDLTRGNVDIITDNVGACVGPFLKGPVGEFVKVNTEAELVSTFGIPTEENYEYWWTINNYLGYGGVCYVLRADDSVGGEQKMRNATNGSSIYVKNNGHFVETIQNSDKNGNFIAKTPGTWGNALGVSVIDRGADRWIALSSNNVADVETGEIFPGSFGGSFGDLVEGSVQNFEIIEKGIGFAPGREYINNKSEAGKPPLLRPDGTPQGSDFTILVSETDNVGPVTSIEFDPNTKGSGYVDGTNLETKGGSGAGLVVNITANDLGKVTEAKTVTSNNNYTNTLTNAGYPLTVSGVGLQVSNEPITTETGNIYVGTGEGIEFTGNFNNGKLVSILLKRNGNNYREGDFLAIDSIDSLLTPLTPTLVSSRDLQTNIEIIETDSLGEITSIAIGASNGLGYKVDDVIEVVQDGNSSPAYFKIKYVDSDNSLQKVRVRNPGKNYKVNDLITLVPEGGSLSKGIVSVEVVTEGAGYTPGEYSYTPILPILETNAAGQIYERAGGAIADVTIGVDGKLFEIEIISGGFGWRAGDPILFDPDIIGGKAVQSILEYVTPHSQGEGYQDGDYIAVPTIDKPNQGNSASFNMKVVGGKITEIQIHNRGYDYAIGDVLEINNAYLGYTGSGFKTEVTKLDRQGAGGTGKVKEIYSANAVLRISNVALEGEEIPSGTQIADHNKLLLPGVTEAELKWLLTGNYKDGQQVPIRRIVETTISGEKLGGEGHFFSYGVSSISRNPPVNDPTKMVEEEPILFIEYLDTGHFLNEKRFESGSYLRFYNDSGEAVTLPQNVNGERSTFGPIAAVFEEVDHFCYDDNTLSDNQVNVVETPQSYRPRYAADTFGWPRNPRNSQRITKPNTITNISNAPGFQISPDDLGSTYVYSAAADRWIWKGVPRKNDLYTDKRFVYELARVGSWYDRQIAFGNVPWTRLAARPMNTQFAMNNQIDNDALNVVVYDRTGEITGLRDTILETYTLVSKLKGATTPEGEANYYGDVINNRSSYVYAHKPLNPGPYGRIPGYTTKIGDIASSNQRVDYVNPTDFRLGGGVDNLVISIAETQDGYSRILTEGFEDLDFILAGPASPSLTDGDRLDASLAKINNIISICESRQDCMCFISPPRELIVGVNDPERTTDAIIAWANQLASSSYAVIDSGYKYTYDRFSKTESYRYVPLNGDIAGLMVYTSIVAEPWYSPAGLSRGQVRNVIRLPYNPSLSQRDELYVHRINPVVTFPGEGTILYGDKTALGFTSAFDRINVRKLFLTLERAIAKSARTTLFEFNDEITRSLFKNNITPFLRDVQARRGMYDFLVVCDSSNNPPEVIDRNEFVADIYIKPTKSINYVSLNFIATKTGVTFAESIGLFRSQVSTNSTNLI